jgi:hypothetical protein
VVISTSLRLLFADEVRLSRFHRTTILNIEPLLGRPASTPLRSPSDLRTEVPTHTSFGAVASLHPAQNAGQIK